MGEPSSEPKMLESLSGQLLDGRYELSEEIGRGGMSRIFKANDSLMGRHVAVKLLALEQENNPLVKERFNREIKALSMLEHENLVKILSAGLANVEGANDAKAYFAMELLHGSNLEEVFKTVGKLDSDEFARIFLPVLQGLKFAHCKLIVHRDLKPANIFICAKDDSEQKKESIEQLLEDLENTSARVKILDFGIAKFFDKDVSRSSVTATLAGLGTPEYMSPEQAAGKNADVRSDIYALACIMYQAITGRPPFHGATALETMYAQLRESAPRIKDLTGSRNYSHDLVNTVIQALDKDPEKRPQTAEDFEKKVLLGLSLNAKLMKNNGLSYLSFLAAIFVLLLLAPSFFAFQKAMRMQKDKSLEVLEKETAIKHRVIGHSGRNLFDEGVRADKAGHPEQAKDLYLAALDNLPDRMLAERREAYIRLALDYCILNQLQEALQAYDNALRFVEPDNNDARATIWMEKLTVYRRLHRTEDMQKSADECLKLSSAENLNPIKAADCLKTYASFEQGRARFDEANKYAKKALKIYDEYQARENSGAIETSWIIFDCEEKSGSPRSVSTRELQKTFSRIKESEGRDGFPYWLADFGDQANFRKFHGLAKRCFELGIRRIHFTSPQRGKIQKELAKRIADTAKLDCSRDLPEIK